MLKRMTGLHLSLLQQEQALPSSSETPKRPRESSGSTPNTQHKQSQFDAGNVEQKGESEHKPFSSNTSTSYAGALKAGGIKLEVSRKVSEERCGMMNDCDLRVIQSAITRMILRSNPGFLIQVERTFLHKGKVLLICKDDKTLVSAKNVIKEIRPSAENHPGYEARGPRDAPPYKTFGIWIPDDEE